MIRHGEVRHYAGQLVSGSLRVGDRVTVHPSGVASEITGIEVLGTDAEVAYAPQSITVRLADQLDVSRGDMIAAGTEAPTLTQDVRAAVCHLADRPLRVGDRVLVRHTTRTVKGIVKDIGDGVPPLERSREWGRPSCPRTTWAGSPCARPSRWRWTTTGTYAVRARSSSWTRRTARH